ncbi:MAG: zinc ABC transporter substrate-binding protein [Arcobacteraceae bacterium]
MKKLIVTALLGLTTFTYANVNAVVSILPQETFLKKIGADKVNVSLMVQPGKSPHTYEPKPSQMKDISQADLYFSIGVEFEHVWLKKFQNQNKKMLVVDMGEGIHKIEIAKHSHGHEDEAIKDEHKGHDHGDDEHDEDNLDPHIWTSPSNVKVMAHNIYNQLVKIDSENTAYYKKNLETFLQEIEQTDKKIKEYLKNTPKHTKFMVFHPSWGYFAKDYDLEQFAIESGGKNPKPKQLAHLIDEAKEENVKAVFTAPEFSTKSAKQIAKEVGIPVVKVSPLSASWSENLIGLAKAISNK